MADGGFRFSGAGQYFYPPQNQQSQHPRHIHQRAHSPVNNPRLGFANTDTPSPSRSPGTNSPAFSMFNQGHHQSQHSLLNGAQPHQRYQMQMNMSKHFPNHANQHHANHNSHQHQEHGSANGQNFVNHQHNMSTSTLTSTTPHFTPSHLHSTTPVGNAGEVNRPSSQHWVEQIKLAQASREAREPHHYARTTPGVNKQVLASLQAGGEQREDEKTDASRTTGSQKADRQLWQALDFSGQRIKSISQSLFRYPFLEKLYFNNNVLTWLPPDIGQLRCLTFLDLSQNDLTSLPPEIGMLVNLKTLLVFDNQLETLPYEMGYLYQLKTLGIEGNQRLDDELKQVLAEGGTSQLIQYMREQAEPCAPPNERDWVLLDETPTMTSEDDRFTVFDCNILCPKYVTVQQYPYVPSGALAWEHRREIVLNEIHHRDADILCLQEIDSETFHEDFRANLAHDDYKGVFWPKGRATTMSERDAKFVDGCAIFYKNSKYILLDKQVIEFGRQAVQRPDMKGEHDVFNRVMTRDDIATVAFLENRATGSRLIVVNTHIFWNPIYADVKVVQIAILMEHVTRFAEGYTKWPACKDKEVFKYANGESDGAVRKEPAPSMKYDTLADIPMLICGDFNSTPGSGPYDLLAHGSLSNTHPDLAGRSYGAFTKEGMYHPFSLKSSYSNIGEMEFTNYTADWQGVVDYIWYSTNSLTNTGLLGEIDRNYLQRVPGFPSWHFPSDHLPLYSEFVVKGKKEKKVVEADFGPQRDRDRNRRS